MLSAISVTSAGDTTDANDGVLTLREAITQAAAAGGADTISFSAGVISAGTISLSSPLSLVDVYGDITIDGPGADQLAIDGTSNVLTVASTNTTYALTIRGLKLTGCTGVAITKEWQDIDLNLDKVEISGNGAGALKFGNGDLTITDSTIADNTGLLAALYIGSGTATLTNVTISGNETGGAAAGVWIANATATLTNVTIADNIADSTGGAGGISVGSSGSVTLQNSIVADNWGGASGTAVRSDIAASGTGTITGSYNLIGFDSNTSNGINDGSNNNIVGGEGSDPAVNADLAPLGYYGGPTRTHFLYPTSQAVNSGSNALVSASYDQRGVTRILGGTVDRGAVEINKIVVTLATDENDSNFSANDLSLREAVIVAAGTSGTDAIVFDSELYDDEVLVDSNQIVINSDVVIQGWGTQHLTVFGGADPNDRIFYVNSGKRVTIRDLTIEHGYATEEDPYGGAIENSGDLTLERVALLDNYSFTGGSALAQRTSGASMHLIDCTIADGIAAGDWNASGTDDAGAIYANAGSILIKSSTISENTVNNSGGTAQVAGIQLEGSASLTMVNSTISGNERGVGMRVNGSSASATLTNCTIAFNVLDLWDPNAGPSGIEVLAGNVMLINTIVAENAGGDISGTFNSSSHHNLIGFDSNTSNGINDGSNNNIVGGEGSDPAIDPLLDVLDYYGGLTKTHRLLEGSLAIDAGDDIVDLIYDQRGEGFPRDLGDAFDIGAYEFDPEE